MSNDPKAPAGPHKLPSLPFAESALEPAISANTLGFHHGKHHKGYVDALNKAVAGTPYADMTLEQPIAATAGKADQAAVFNNAAQTFGITPSTGTACGTAVAATRRLRSSP